MLQYHVHRMLCILGISISISYSPVKQVLYFEFTQCINILLNQIHIQPEIHKPFYCWLDVTVNSVKSDRHHH